LGQRNGGLEKGAAKMKILEIRKKVKEVNSLLKERDQLAALAHAIRAHSNNIDDNSDAEDTYLKNVEKRINSLDSTLLQILNINETN
jgi:uncharacterized protein YlxW (UPF0749 family)